VTPSPDRPSLEPDQLQAGAAEIAHHALGVGLPRNHAEGGIARFLLAGEDADPQAGFSMDPGQEFPAIDGVPSRGGGDHHDLRGVQAIQNGAEAAHGRHGGLDALGRQPSGGGQVTTKAGQGLFVEHSPDRPAFQPVDDETYGVRAQVDDGGLATG
jgi:hypothetical protein